MVDSNHTVVSREGGHKAPFLILLLLLVAAFATHGNLLALWLGGVLLVALLLVTSSQRVAPSLLTLSLGCLMGWVLATTLLGGQPYRIEALYLPLYVAGGYLLAVTLAQRDLAGLYRAVLLFLAASALLAIAQSYFHAGYLLDRWPRANGLLAEHNSFATLLNLGLLPLLSLYLQQQRSRRWLLLIVLLFMALQLTQSRGGLLAFIFGFGVILVLHHYCWKLERNRLLPLLLALLVGFLLVQGGSRLLAEHATSLERLSTAVADNGSGRVDLYRMAWQQLEEAPWYGIGTLNFGYYFLRDQGALFRGNEIAFVHNDYLQLWLETGVVGLLLYLAVIGAMVWQVVKGLRSADNRHRTQIIAGAAAAAAFFSHSLIDYPLYSPPITLALGLILGVLSRAPVLAAAADSTHGRGTAWLHELPVRPRVLLLLVSLPLFWWLAQPVIASYYAKRADDESGRGMSVEAFEHYSLASRIEPGNPRYWAAQGVLLATSAIEKQDRFAAAEADWRFARGANLNPYEFDNLIQRLVLHRDYPQLLETPASDAVIVEWARTISRWRPNDGNVTYQLALTLTKTGDLAGAQQQIRIALDKRLIDEETYRKWSAIVIKEQGRRMIAPLR